MRKKTYATPQIVFESFQLTANIAGNCNTRPSITDETTWGYNDNGWIVFQNSAVCIDGRIGPDDNYNGLCYHVPTGNMSVFTS